ncbi:hypothetical protein HMI54_000437 [Coelomomyces lativittatus]|nr:hypothetical protein HMI56_002387 [Coelomomyces lativittatus]KAJ1511893.1 hypothetical protein HMI54_000437 [Coelomomyces lativittatus]
MCHGLDLVLKEKPWFFSRPFQAMTFSMFLYVIASMVLILPFMPVLGASVDKYAPCTLDPKLTNSPYCPQLPNNIQSPLENEVYTLGNFITCSWNSKWNSFATTGNVDVYLCPNSSPINCVTVSSNVPSNVEQLSYYLNPSNFTVGPYFYLVVAAGSSVNVPFSDRGASLTIVSASASSPPSIAFTATTTVTATSTTVTATSTTVAATSTPTTETSKDPSSPLTEPSSSFLSPWAIACIVLGCLLLVCIVLGLIVFMYRRHKQQKESPPLSPVNEMGKVKTVTPISMHSTRPSLFPQESLPLSPLPPTHITTPTLTSQPKLTSLSTQEAILLANSFKLALHHPSSWSSSPSSLHELESLSSAHLVEPLTSPTLQSMELTMSELGMKSLPRVISSSSLMSSKLSLNEEEEGQPSFTVEPIHPMVKKPENILEVKSGTYFDIQQTESIPRSSPH